jgi:hypothetical protein
MPIFIATSLYQRSAAPGKLRRGAPPSGSRQPWARLWYIFRGEFALQELLLRIEDTIHDGNPAPKRKSQPR